MEIALKTGEELECDYTGTPVGVLVRLEGSHPDAPKTGWLSRKALEDALRVISSLDGGGAPVARPMAAGAHVGTPAAPAPQEGAAPAVPPNPARPAAPNMEVVQNFHREAVRLVKDAEREEPEEGKSKGVREQDLRDLILKFKPVFGSSGAQAAFRVLNLAIGMDRQRFDLIWNMKPERLTSDGATDD